jgi:Secretion system C-terminal sorting domain
MKNLVFSIIFFFGLFFSKSYSQMIDFENISDYTTTTIEPFEINNSYFQTNFCIEFYEDDIGGNTPRIGQVGLPASGYTRNQGALSNLDCGQDTPTILDMPNQGQNVGCYFLTTNRPGGARPLVIDYQTNCGCNEASGYIMDIDFNESWQIQVFDNDASSTPISSQVISSGDPGTGDAVATQFTVGPFSAPIEKIILSYVGTGSPGFAFDNFSFCSIEPPVDSSAYCCDGENLINNGNFENGVNGFISKYNLASKMFGPGDYNVIDYNNANFICSNWNVEDHTRCVDGDNSPNNQILIVNGQTQQNNNSNNVIWQTEQPIQVEQDSQYKFCAFVKHLPQCCFDITPKIKIQVKHQGNSWVNLQDWSPLSYTGQDVAPCDWEQVGGTFFAVNSKVRIRILIDEQGNGDGNDLALDDISLMKLPKPDFYIKVDDTAPTDPLVINASIFEHTSTDDLLPDDSCKYVWAIAEIIGINPIQLDWSQSILNGWFGGTSPNINNNWGLTTNFPGISIPGGEKMYRVYFGIVDCECTANKSVYALAGGGEGYRSKNEQYLASKYQSEEEKMLADFYLNKIVEMGRNNTDKKQIIDEINSELEFGAFKDKFRSDSHNVNVKMQSSQVNNEGNIRIYPNPFSNEFTVSFDGAIKEISLYGSTGKNFTSLIKQERGVNSINIDGSELPVGIYFVRMENEIGSYFKAIKIDSY